MGFSSRFSTVALALLGSTLLVQETRSQLTECSASSADGFDYEVTLGTESGTDFDIRWSVDTEVETISFEVSTTAESWISVGFSVDGSMTGADAVIGLPDSNEVVEYDLIAKALDQVTRYPEQEITDPSISLSPSGTTIAFTRPLSPSTEGKETLSATPGDETWLIYAFGLTNELAQHEQDSRGNALLDLFCGDTAAAGEDSDAPTVAPTTLSPLVEGETHMPAATPVDSGDGGDGGDGEGSTAPTAMPTAVGSEASVAPTDTAAAGSTTPTTMPTAVGSEASVAPTDTAAAGEDSEAPTVAPTTLSTLGEGETNNPVGIEASDAPTAEEDGDAEDTETEADAAFRVSGGVGLWVAAATATAAMLGAAMAV